MYVVFSISEINLAVLLKKTTPTIGMVGANNSGNLVNISQLFFYQIHLNLRNKPPVLAIIEKTFRDHLSQESGWSLFANIQPYIYIANIDIVFVYLVSIASTPLTSNCSANSFRMVVNEKIFKGQNFVSKALLNIINVSNHFKDLKSACDPHQFSASC